MPLAFHNYNRLMRDSASQTQAWISGLFHRRAFRLSILILLLAWSAAGLFAVPAAVRHAFRSLIEATGQKLTVRRITVNPFNLSVTLHDLALLTKDEKPFMEIETLHANLQASSLLRRAWTLSRLEITAPHVFLEREPHGGLNLPGQGGSSDGSRPLNLIIRSFKLSDGRIDFSDLARSRPFSLAIASMSLNIRELDTRPERQAAFTFLLKGPHGTELDLEGTVSFTPFRTSASLKVSRLLIAQLAKFMEWPSPMEAEGLLNARTDILLDKNEDGPAVLLRNGEIEVKNLRIRNSPDREIAAVPWLKAAGITLNIPKRHLEMGSFESHDGSFLMRVIRQPETRLESVFTLPGKADSPEPPGSDSPPWRCSLSKGMLSNFSFALEDEVQGQALKTELRNINFEIRGLSSDRGSPFSATADLVPMGQGRISAEIGGTLSPLSVKSNTAIRNFSVSHFSPYAAQFMNAAVPRGSGSASGVLEVIQEDGKPLVAFSGKAALEDFQIVDSIENGDIFSWKSLGADSLSLAFLPASIGVERIVLSGAKAHIVRNELGEMNLGRLMLKKPERSSPVEPAPQEETAAKNVMPLRIAGIEIQDGELSFADKSLASHVTIEAKKIQGSLADISSERWNAIPLDLSADLLPRASITAGGNLNFAGRVPFNKLNLKIREAALSQLGPYIERFAGVKISRGEYEAAFDYKNDGNNLSGTNSFAIKGLEFGGPSSDPKAGSMPVQLAAALMRDSRGNISFSFPTAGNTSSPEFKLGGVIRDAFLNVLTKAVTSPFSILASVAGTDKPLDVAEFAPGSAELSFEERQRLNALSKALSERPTLLLRIVPRFDPDVDKRGLAEALIRQNLEKARQRKKIVLNLMDIPQHVPELEKDEYAKYLPDVYKAMAGRSLDAEALNAKGRREMIEFFSGSTGSSLSADALAAAHEELIQAAMFDEDLLTRLASVRADAVRSYLTGEGKVSPDRISTAPAESTRFKSRSPYLSLAVSAKGQT